MKANTVLKTFPVLVEFTSTERKYEDDGPDSCSADIGAGVLKLYDGRVVDFDVDFDVFRETHADERAPQLMKNGRVISLCDDFGAGQLVTQKKRGKPQFLMPNIDVQSYCVAPNGKDIYATDEDGRLYFQEEGNSPERVLHRKLGFEVQGFTEDKTSLVLTRWKDDALEIGTLEPKSLSWTNISNFNGLDDNQALETSLTQSGSHLFLQQGDQLSRINLSDKTIVQRTLERECDCVDEMDGVDEDWARKDGICEPLLKSALDERFVILATDQTDYEESDENYSWPYRLRPLVVYDMETEYYSARDSSVQNIVPMNGKPGSSSRYYREFEDQQRQSNGPR